MTAMTSIEFIDTVKTAFADNNIDRVAVAGILRGTAMAATGRAVNAGVSLLLAERDQRGRGSDAAASRVRRAEERLADAAALLAVVAPFAAAHGVDVNGMAQAMIADAGMPSAARTAADLDAARAAALDLVTRVGGGDAIRRANQAAATRDAKDGAYIQDRGDQLRELLRSAVHTAGSGQHPLPHDLLAREFERLWESATRQCGWIVEKLQRTRLPSRVAQLGAEAAALALVAREFETLASTHYAAAEEQDATPPEGETFVFSQAGLGIFDL